MSNAAETAERSAPESRDVVMQIDVAFGDPAPNRMFSPWQHYITKFLTFSKSVPCAHCGRKGMRHWTLLKFFRVMEEGAFTLKPSEQEYPPLTPVCTKHILSESKA